MLSHENRARLRRDFSATKGRNSPRKVPRTVVNRLFSEIFLVMNTESSSCGLNGHWETFPNCLQLQVHHLTWSHGLMLQMQVIQGDCHSMASPVRMFSVPPPLHKPRNTLSLQTLTFVTVSSSFYKILVSFTSPFPDPSHCTCMGVGPKAIRIFHIGVKVLISTLVSPH